MAILAASMAMSLFEKPPIGGVDAPGAGCVDDVEAAELGTEDPSRGPADDAKGEGAEDADDAEAASSFSAFSFSAAFSFSSSSSCFCSSPTLYLINPPETFKKVVSRVPNINFLRR